ncbi:MAG: hypothetical protein BGP01_11695 [Paludibacter sp. 47-17]|nr:MAG: hypothetical protein BGP01_11695 [Paludibacter sp. 47-17]
MKISIVLTGYYFRNKHLYEQILQETKLYDSISFNLFILSHKAEYEISVDIYNYLITNNWQIIYQPNIGWDWGCHAQFVQWHNKSNLPNPNFVLFLHDDIIVCKNGFIREYLTLSCRGYELIGNSLPFTKIKSFEHSYADEAYILSKSGCQYESGEVKVVRGSAFFISFDLAVKALSNLPYQKYGSIHLANRSLRMFGAVATFLVGKERIGYLSDKHFSSEYISEEMRGQSISPLFFVKRHVVSFISKVRIYVSTMYSRVILNHTYTLNSSGLKVNVTHNNDIQYGYLNLIIDNLNGSDVSFDELVQLFEQYKICSVKIPFSIASTNEELMSFLFSVILKSNKPVDVLIDVDNLIENDFHQFLNRYSNVDVKQEVIFRLKSFKFGKRLYIKYLPHKVNY